jgi:photosystem II stability/assembly factor-like uncharacterized protein
MLLTKKTLARAALALSFLSCAAAATIDLALWSGLRYRMIGPERGGRVTAVTGVPSQPNTFYMGSTGGGVWKTTDAGHTWVNISDGQIPLGSMGAIEVSLSDPNVIYAGTGSSKIRSNVSIGRGIYKSTDAGKTWAFAGLRDVGQISTVRVHPANPDMVWVAALGNPFADNPERGVYRTTDGGRNWRKVLHISDSAGAADVELQPGSPSTPVTDIKVAHQDLILATQGRSFWILDNLTPLHQAGNAATSALLYKPREAIRSPSRGGGGRDATLQYPQPGAAIDYYLSALPAGDIAMEILDAAGQVIRKFSSAGASAGEAPPVEVEAAPNEDGEGGGGRFRGGPTRIDKTPGMHRFSWDLRYPGAWQSPARPESPNGPAAAPGRYAVRLTVGDWTATQPFTLTEDLRITASGVTTEDLREQFDHNMKVRDLVSEVNRTVSRVRAGLAQLAGKPDSAATLASLKDLAASLITPTVRYSKPELQTHIAYLYSETNGTDQKVGRDAIERYHALRQELDQRIAQLDKILK